MTDVAIFSLVPVEVLTDHRLTLIETRVIAAILSFRNKNTNVSFPSREKIAERCGYSEGTVSNATKSLVEKGWLKKTKKVFNGPNTYEVIVPDEPHRSGDIHRTSDNHQTGEDEPHRSGEHSPHRSGEPNRHKNKPKNRPLNNKSAVVCPIDVDASVWQDFVTLRKTKKAPITETAVEGIRREAIKAGYSMNDAIRTCCERGWQGFKASWVRPEILTDPRGRVSPITMKSMQNIQGWLNGTE